MKKTTLFIALLCSVSAFSTRYLVDSPSITWRTAGAGEVNVTTGTAFNTWFAATTFVATVDEVWMAAGTYSVAAVTTLKDGVNIYGSFAGTETAVSQRAKNSSLAWDFTNQTVLDGGQTIDLTGTGGYGGLTAPIFTNLTTIDGLKVTRFYKAVASGHGCGVTLNTNATMQNCIISYNRIFATAASCGSAAGIFLSTAGAKLLNSYIYNNQTVKLTGGTVMNGGGVMGMGDVTVKGCTIEGNTAVSGGGGLFISFSSTYALAANKVGGGTIEDCILKSNIAGGIGGGLGILVTPTNPLSTSIKNCQFVENTAFTTGGGASLSNQDGTLTLEGCKFVGNKSTGVGNGGLYIANTWLTVNPIKNCIFRDNFNKTGGTDEGAAFNINKVATIQNCVVVNNTGGASAGYMAVASSKVYNCTFANNAAIALKFAAVATCEAKNNVFWNNTDNTITGGTTPTLDYNGYSGVTGADAGTHSITSLTVSPNNTFLSPTTYSGAQTSVANKTESDGANWALKSTCPAVDAGLDLSLLIPTAIDGTPRPDGPMDMGAYETHFSTSVNSLMAQIQILSRNNGIELSGLTSGQIVTVYSTTGIMVTNQSIKSSETFIALPKGIYMIQINNKTCKVAVR